MAKTKAKNTTADPARDKDKVSVIVPVFNEMETIEEVFQRLVAVFEEMGREYELVFIDDGSTDGCSDVMQQFPERNDHTRVVRFSRNFGQQNAIVAGFDYAHGEILVFIDADLQTKPEEIPRLIEKMDEGYDVVSGYRNQRDESFLLRQLPSRTVNLIFKKLMKHPQRDIGCGFQAIRKEILAKIDPQSPMSTHRVIFASWRGGKFAEIPIDFFPRGGGESKYNTLSLLHLFFDILMTFITQPYELVLFVSAGLAAAGTGISGLLILIIASIFGATAPAAIWAILITLLFSGLVSFAFGVINERLNRITHRINKTPIYVVGDVFDGSGISKD